VAIIGHTDCAHNAAEGAAVFAKACELGLEGIVSKRAGSFYKSGRSRNWLKTKNPNLVRT
jgi:ATP-dependent DNA ligase